MYLLVSCDPGAGLIISFSSQNLSVAIQSQPNHHWFACVNLTALPWETWKWIPPFERRTWKIITPVYVIARRTRTFRDGLVWICKLLILPPSCAECVLSLNGRNPRRTCANRCSGCIIYAINYGAFNSLMSALIYSATCTVGRCSLFLFCKTAVWKVWAIIFTNGPW